ncbi:MAG: helix-hairpin-helix domain-containing protein [Bacteroidetes bacterium]|nr:helix-hairpin-helix domain-containing protein [Bacteroidota bacterium]MCW5894029.1 helix-hairpin-helix domain-containing protein [Bacteroidota bacterium]
MRVLKRIQDTVGFTRKEAVSILTLSTVFLVGTGIRWLQPKENRDADTRLQFDYSRQDSLYAEAAQKHAQLVTTSVDSTKPATRSSHKTLRVAAVNINTAGKTQLMSLPGIGEAYAERILEYRKTNGRFNSVEELSKVKGIGKKKLEKIRPHVRVQ